MDKTYEAWGNSRKNMDEFLQIGDVVDQDFVDYFINVLPPACLNPFVIQIGEPNSHINDRATYATLAKTPAGWTYAGHCYRGETIHQKSWLEIQREREEK